MENKRTTRAREQFYSSLDKEGFTLADGNEFVNSRTYLYIVCPEGHTLKTCPNKFQQGRRCPYCSKKVKKTTESFKQEVKELTNNEFSVLSEYKNARTPLLMKHNHCGREFFIAPSTFLGKLACKDCSYKQRGLDRRFTQEEFELKVKEVGKGEFSLQSKYETTNQQVLLKHEVCGCEWWSYPNNFLHYGIVCRQCEHTKSKGEELIKEYLDENEIEYLFQHTYDDLKHKRALAYDFYIPEKNLLIEYDGLQHFKPIEYFGGEKAFKERQFKDNLKNEYAKQNNIDLIRIPYYENSIEVLKEVLGGTNN